MAKTVYYFDMDGVLADFHTAYAEDKAVAYKREAMAELAPFADAVAVVKGLIANGKSVYINSLAANEDGKLGKLEWLAKYLPELKKSHIIISVGYVKKASVMKTKTGILIDDKLANCKQWERMTGQRSVWVEVKGRVEL